MGSTAHVGINALNVNDADGPRSIFRQPSTLHLVIEYPQPFFCKYNDQNI